MISLESSNEAVNMKMGTSLSHLSPSNIAEATSDLAPETFMKLDGAKVGIDFEDFFTVTL